MKHRITFSRRAEAQLDGIYSHLSKEAGPEIAARFIDALLAYCDTLQTSPHRGTLYQHIYPGLRVIGFRRTVSIQFVVTAEEVRILNLSHRGQDYLRYFRERQKG